VAADYPGLAGRRGIRQTPAGLADDFDQLLRRGIEGVKCFWDRIAALLNASKS
jgi:hypothetical protein